MSFQWGFNGDRAHSPLNIYYHRATYWWWTTAYSSVRRTHSGSKSVCFKRRCGSGQICGFWVNLIWEMLKMIGLEVSDTKNDLRNVFFREFWVYRVKGLNSFCFTKKMSAVFTERDVSSTRIWNTPATGPLNMKQRERHAASVSMFVSKHFNTWWIDGYGMCTLQMVPNSFIFGEHDRWEWFLRWKLPDGEILNFENFIQHFW